MNINLLSHRLRTVRKISIMGLIAYIVVYYGLILFADEGISVIASDILGPVGLLSSMLIMAIGIRNHHPGKMRIIWMIFLAGAISFFAGDLSWFYYEIILNQSPYPSIADLFYVIQSFLFLSAMFMLLPKTSLLGIVRNGFDALIVMSIFILLEIKFIILPLIADMVLVHAFDALALIYPVFDIVIMFVSMILLFNNERDHSIFKSKVIISIGLVWVIVDQLYSIGVIYGNYSSGNLIDPLWPIMLWGLAIESLVSAEHRFDDEGSQGVQPLEIHSGNRSRFLTIITHICLVIFVVFVFIVYFIPDVISIGSSFIIILVIIRLLLSQLENKRLLVMIEESNHKLLNTNDMLDHEAKVDFLTGLYNRRGILKVLDDVSENSRQTRDLFSVIMIDIDHFKKVNDVFGHDGGDDVLRQVSEVMVRNVRKCDFVGRFGGEEFIVILPATDINVSASICERIRNEISKSNPLIERLNTSVRITVSGGVSQCVTEDEKYQDVISRADKALYNAKQSGRNKVVCDLSNAI